MPWWGSRGPGVLLPTLNPWPCRSLLQNVPTAGDSEPWGCHTLWVAWIGLQREPGTPRHRAGDAATGGHAGWPRSIVPPAAPCPRCEEQGARSRRVPEGLGAGGSSPGWEQARGASSVPARRGASRGSVWSVVPDPSLREHSVMD